MWEPTSLMLVWQALYEDQQSMVDDPMSHPRLLDGLVARTGIEEGTHRRLFRELLDRALHAQHGDDRIEEPDGLLQTVRLCTFSGKGRSELFSKPHIAYTDTYVMQCNPDPRPLSLGCGFFFGSADPVGTFQDLTYLFREIGRNVGFGDHVIFITSCIGSLQRVF